MYYNNFNVPGTPGAPGARAATAASPWFRCYQPRPAATKRVIILPHAGGSASYFRSWAAHFPADVEVLVVQYPGREDRLKDSLIGDMSTLVQQLCTGLSHKLDKPYLLFGHSMGGAVAYELYRTIVRRGLNKPQRLVVSAIEAPTCNHDGDLHLQSDQALLAELTRLGGSNVDFVAFPELAEMVVPMMRSDYRLIECYQPKLPTTVLDTPITVMVGDADDELRDGDAEAWQQETSADFDLLTFKGGHFYLNQQAIAVCMALNNCFASIKGQRRAVSMLP